MGVGWVWVGCMHLVCACARACVCVCVHALTCFGPADGGVAAAGGRTLDDHLLVELQALGGLRCRGELQLLWNTHAHTVLDTLLLNV